MKQFLFLAAIYSLVIYQSQKNTQEKNTTSVVQNSIAHAAAESIRQYQQELAPGYRFADFNTLNQTGSVPTHVKWDENQ
jgi:hypothetical protein